MGEPLPIDSKNPRLMRTGTLANRLVERGHAVIWWTSAFDHYKKIHRTYTDTTFEWSGGTIRMLKSAGYKRNISLRRFVEHAGVARKFRREALKSERPDIILVSLPTIELARDAVHYGRSVDVPVLVDVRDLWPDLLIDTIPKSLKKMGRLILRPLINDATYALAKCTGIIGVSTGYLDWGLGYAARFRRDTDGIFPLGYVVPKCQEAHIKENLEKISSHGIDATKKICWFVGSFGRQYDLEPVLYAAKCFQKDGRTDIQFVISGDGELGEHWRSLAHDAKNIIFTGWIDADEINWLRTHAYVGLQPYLDGAPQGLANKLFEYISAGIPVVSSLRGENEELIAKNRCGLTYRAGDGNDCVNKLTVILDDRELRLEMGRNAKDLFEKHFDSEIIFDGLITHLENVYKIYKTRRN